MAFVYPLTRHTRRHGPAGYRNYKEFKPWLRDEFAFRCVYCLVRERHYPIGQAAFSVDHLLPQAVAPELACSYDNLVYSCSRCNAYKGECDSLLDPCEEPYGEHLQVILDGSVHGLTSAGNEMVTILDLNHPELIRFRSHVLWELQTAAHVPPSEASRRREHWQGYPPDLPDLSRKRPPGGNTRREGLHQTYFSLRERGQLSTTY